ncbi:hypothetical protein [Nonomuraea sp. NPDC050643]|uniref:hypothetical protein n=1 Tax=Nonomuraea sp. NPDC050643 TaxID=3155660 RepID=UPI0033C06D6C
MGRDDSKAAVLGRTEDVWPEIFGALRAGIDIAAHLHSTAGWDPQDDKHLYQHMIRRKAVEAFKGLSTEFDEDDDQSDAALSMSGLMLRLEHDVIRIWHITPLEIPKPGSKTKREFIAQPPSGQTALFDVRDLMHRLRRDDRNHLILRWTIQHHTITRFDLVRPSGVKKGKVVVDWQHDLRPLCMPPPVGASPPA